MEAGADDDQLGDIQREAVDSREVGRTKCRQSVALVQPELLVAQQGPQLVHQAHVLIGLVVTLEQFLRAVQGGPKAQTFGFPVRGRPARGQIDRYGRGRPVLQQLPELLFFAEMVHDSSYSLGRSLLMRRCSSVATIETTKAPRKAAPKLAIVKPGVSAATR